MDNKEEVLTALEDFGQKPSENVPQILEDYLRQVAKTGVTIFPWPKLQPLFEQSLDNAMREFHKRVPMEQLPSSPNVESVTFDTMRERLMAAVKTFTGAPFTIQRLCELVTSPGKHYKRTDKFLRGIEKNVLVVSTVDPFGRKIVNEATHMIVNGMESNNTITGKPDLAGGPNPEKMSSPFMPPAPSNSPIASGDWFSHRNVDSPSRFPQWTASESQAQNPLQALDKITEATCSSSSATVSKPVWCEGNTLAELTSDTPPVKEDTDSSTEGTLPESDKIADNVSSSSDSSTNESPLSDLSNDSEAEFTSKPESLEVDTEQGDKDSVVQESSSQEHTVTTSEANSVTGTDRQMEGTQAADISSEEEMGQGDRATTSSASTTADEIDHRRSSAGFEPTRSVTSIMAEDEESEEPQAKKPRLDDSGEQDLSSSTAQLEEPSQSEDKVEDSVGSTEGLVEGGSEEMSCSSEVEQSDATGNLLTESDDSLGFSTTTAKTEAIDEVESSDDTKQEAAVDSQENMEDSEASVSSQSEDKADSVSDDSESAATSEEGQCDSISEATECDSSPKDQQSADSAEPEPMETEES